MATLFQLKYPEAKTGDVFVVTSDFSADGVALKVGDRITLGTIDDHCSDDGPRWNIPHHSFKDWWFRMEYALHRVKPISSPSLPTMARTFKENEIYRVEGHPYMSGSHYEGEYFKISNVQSHGIYGTWFTTIAAAKASELQPFGGWSLSFEDTKHLIPISHSQSLVMSVKQFFKNKLRSAEDKALIKAGLMDDCGDLTPEGKEAITSIASTKFKEDLVTLAKEMIEEKETEAKKCSGCK